MGNRSQEENEAILLGMLRQVGDQGLTIDEARHALSAGSEQSKSLAKKVLEHLREKGIVRVKMGKSGICSTVIPGR